MSATTDKVERKKKKTNDDGNEREKEFAKSLSIKVAVLISYVSLACAARKGGARRQSAAYRFRCLLAEFLAGRSADRCYIVEGKIFYRIDKTRSCLRILIDLYNSFQGPPTEAHVLAQKIVSMEDRLDCERRGFRRYPECDYLIPAFMRYDEKEINKQTYAEYIHPFIDLFNERCVLAREHRHRLIEAKTRAEATNWALWVDKIEQMADDTFECDPDVPDDIKHFVRLYNTSVLFCQLQPPMGQDETDGDCQKACEGRASQRPTISPSWFSPPPPGVSSFATLKATIQEAHSILAALASVRQYPDPPMAAVVLYELRNKYPAASIYRRGGRIVVASTKSWWNLELKHAVEEANAKLDSEQQPVEPLDEFSRAFLDFDSVAGGQRLGKFQLQDCDAPDDDKNAILAILPDLMEEWCIPLKDLEGVAIVVKSGVHEILCVSETVECPKWSQLEALNNRYVTLIEQHALRLRAAIDCLAIDCLALKNSSALDIWSAKSAIPFDIWSAESAIAFDPVDRTFVTNNETTQDVKTLIAAYNLSDFFVRLPF